MANLGLCEVLVERATGERGEPRWRWTDSWQDHPDQPDLITRAQELSNTVGRAVMLRNELGGTILCLPWRRSVTVNGGAS